MYWIKEADIDGWRLDVANEVDHELQAGEDIRRQKVAALFLMMHIGVPSIYYGDEKGFAGMTDIEYRKPMQWTDTDIVRNVYVFSREANGKKLIIVINNSEYPVKYEADIQSKKLQSCA